MRHHDPVYLVIAGLGMLILALGIRRITKQFPDVKVPWWSWAIFVFGEIVIAIQGLIPYVYG